MQNNSSSINQNITLIYGNVISRQQALEWWRSLPSNTQLEFWRQYQETTFTPSGSPDQLTGREIEQIYTQQSQTQPK